MPTHSYSPLPPNPPGVDSTSTWKPLPPPPAPAWRRGRRSLPEHLCGTVVPWTITALSWAFFLIYWIHHRGDSPIPDLLYSPAQTAIRYELRTFPSYPTDPPSVFSPLHPNHTATEEAWSGLYHPALHIPRSQAEQLPNGTAPAPGYEGDYIVQLEVFRQLECLDDVRKATMGKEVDKERVAQCVEVLREGVMCAADTTVRVWQWQEEEETEKRGDKGKMIERGTARTCRDWEAIKVWAEERAVEKVGDVRERWGEEVGGKTDGNGGSI